MDNPVMLLVAGRHRTLGVKQDAREQARTARGRCAAHLAARVTAVAVLMSALLCTSAGLATAASERLNINTATVEQLTSLPGIGAAKAAAIVEERGRLPFAEVDDLARVKGIGPALVADLRDRVEVGVPDRD